MRRLLVKIGAWLAILLGLAMMLQPTAADWLTRQRNSKTAQQFAANTATAADAANTDSASQTAEETAPTRNCTPPCRPTMRRFTPTAKAA